MDVFTRSECNDVLLGKYKNKYVNFIPVVSSKMQSPSFSRQNF